jgi:hypothetical protein
MPETLYRYKDKNQHRSFTPSLVLAYRRHNGDRSEITYETFESTKKIKRKNKKEPYQK